MPPLVRASQKAGATGKNETGQQATELLDEAVRKGSLSRSPPGLEQGGAASSPAEAQPLSARAAQLPRGDACAADAACCSRTSPLQGQRSPGSPSSAAEPVGCLQKRRRAGAPSAPPSHRLREHASRTRPVCANTLTCS